MLTSIIGLTSLTSATVKAKLKSHLPQAVNNSDFYDNGFPLIAKVKLGRHLFFKRLRSIRHRLIVIMP